VWPDSGSEVVLTKALPVASSQPDKPGPPRHHEGTEVLAAAADDVRVRGELVERRTPPSSTSPAKSTVDQPTVARANRLESHAARPSAVIAAHGTMSYEH
jgi:hypothetical protein